MAGLAGISRGRAASCAALLCAACCALPAAAAPVRVGAPAGVVELGPAARLLLDAGRQRTVEEVLALPDAALEAFGAARVRSFGVTGAAVWVRVELQAEAAGTWQLVFDVPLADRLEVFVVGAARRQHLLGGVSVPPGQRTLEHRGPYHRAPLALAAGEQVTLLARATSHGPLYLSLALLEPGRLDRRDLGSAAGLAFDGGVLLVVIVLSLVRAWTTKSRAAALFAGLFTCYVGFQASLSGVGAAFLWPGWPRWAAASPIVFAAGCLIFLLAYVRAFLRQAGPAPRLERLARRLQWLPLASAAASLFWVGPAALLNSALAVAAFALASAWSVSAAARGDRSARFLVAAMLVTTFFVGWVVAADVGLVPGGDALAVGFRVGVWVAVIVVLLGLDDRRARELEAARSALEVRVEERTAELASTVDKLRVEVAEREAAERGLREEHVRFRMAFDASPDSMLIVRASDGVVTGVNDAFTRNTGWAPGEVVGRTTLEVGIWADQGERAGFREEIKRTGQVDNLERRFHRKDGQEFTGLLSARRAELDGVPQIFSVIRNISDWRRTEQERDRLKDQLRQAQKLEAVGRLAGGVAHDFNNLLTAITANIELARIELAEKDPAHEFFNEISNAASRAAQLTRQLLAFGRRQVIEPKPTELSGLVRGMHSLLKRILGADVVLDLDLAPGLPPALADPGQVEQVLVNLIVNAKDAVPPHGRVVVSTRAVEVPPDQARGGRKPGPWCVLAVADEGAGMSPEVQARAFEPFFSTKGVLGSGLGLSTVHGIAEQHGGFVELDSVVGRGSTFRVHFPVAAQALQEEALSAAALPRGQGTVLFAEDERAVREVTSALLKKLGYQVLEGVDGEHALEVCKRHEGRIDVLLTDAVMPRLNGRELADRVKALRPAVKVIFLSGYTQDVLARDGVLEPGLVLVKKPYQPAELARALQHALQPPDDLRPPA